MTRGMRGSCLIVASLIASCCFMGCQESSQTTKEPPAPGLSREPLFERKSNENSTRSMTVLRRPEATADPVCGDWFYVSKNPVHAGKIITDYQPYSFKPDGTVTCTVLSNTGRRVDNGIWRRTKESDIVETELDYGKSGLQLRKWRLIGSGRARIIFWKNVTFGHERSEDELYVKRGSQEWNAREKIGVAPPVVRSYAIDPVNLTIGEKYRLSSRAALMPEFEPTDALEAIGRMRYLSNGAVIRVVEIRYKRGTPWYRVQSNGVHGWINSTALLGQRLTRVKERIE